jgi:CD36 family
LFEGVEFCRSPVGLPQIVCNQVLERNSPSIIKSPDGAALIFSMFNHVTLQSPLLKACCNLLISQKNRTHDGLYEINSGVRRINRLLRIERWNNARTLRFWKPDRKGAPSHCQMINGTDATATAPFREEGDDFFIYSSDICR